jgi:6-phosphogluconolactonase
MKTFIHTSKTPEDLAEAFARQLITWINEAEGDSFHLALSGGKTPSLLFSLLAQKYTHSMPWQKIHFWWGDERMVAPDDPESNFGVVNQLLFSKIALAADHIHRIRGEANPIEEVKRYGLEIKLLVAEKNGWPVFDLIMLGLGDDGHTASIFPDQMQLLESDEITGIALHPATGQQRITLTGKVLNSAKKVAFLVAGASKALIFDEITHQHKNAVSYPASHIHPNGELHWFVDEALKGSI